MNRARHALCLMRRMLSHKGDDARDDAGGCLEDGLHRQMRSQT